MKNMKNWGVIFDWDGVIVDSSRLHEKSWEILAKQLNLILPEGHFKKGFGMKNDYIIPNILKWASEKESIQQLADRKEALYRELVRDEKIELLPGVRSLLESLARHEIPRTIGSSTCLANIQVVLECTEIAHFFDNIVSAEQVAQGKPHPEVFLKAAQRLNLIPQQCLVIEDTQVGLQAAQAAHMFALGVATTHPAETLTQADRVVDNLTVVSVEELEQWVTDAL
ncbi:MAG: HAD family phosphatase [Verrucomicrobiae bacterium]|nr:HAD family phosphatase [Verrucomicrobiae bacterium]